MTTEQERAYYRRIHKLQTFSQAEEYAKELSTETGEDYIAYDLGPSVSPRYGCMKVFKIGDEVSKALNGDYYPQGKIVQISKSLRRIEVDNGSVFYRYKQTSSWLMHGVWTLVPGTHSKLNPEF